MSSLFQHPPLLCKVAVKVDRAAITAPPRRPYIVQPSYSRRSQSLYCPRSPLFVPALLVLAVLLLREVAPFHANLSAARWRSSPRAFALLLLAPRSVAWRHLVPRGPCLVGLNSYLPSSFGPSGLSGLLRPLFLLHVYCAISSLIPPIRRAQSLSLSCVVGLDRPQILSHVHGRYLDRPRFDWLPS